MGARLLGLIFAGVLLRAGCEQVTSASEPEAEAEQLHDIVPNLPEVPTLPPPPFPTTYEDESYSVYGLRSRLTKVLDSELSVTGYIVDVYEPPPCTKKKKDECPKVAMPHMFIADTAEQADRSEVGNKIRVKGFFTLMSSGGFNTSNGLVEYAMHETLAKPSK